MIPYNLICKILGKGYIYIYIYTSDVMQFASF